MGFVRRKVVVQFGKKISEMTKSEFESHQKEGWIFKPCMKINCKNLECKSCIDADVLIDKNKIKNLKERVNYARVSTCHGESM